MIYTKVQFIYSWVMLYGRSFFPIMLRFKYPFSYILGWVKYKYLFFDILIIKKMVKSKFWNYLDNFQRPKSNGIM